jgi:hypothetical protein
VFVYVPRGILVGVLVLDEQPFVALLTVFELDQYKTAAQLLAVQIELNLALLYLLACAGVADHAERSAIPHHHRSRTIVALGNLSLEARIVQRVILRLHR